MVCLIQILILIFGLGLVYFFHPLESIGIGEIMKSKIKKSFMAGLVLISLMFSPLLSSTTITSGPEDCKNGDSFINTCPTNSFFNSGGGGGSIRYGYVAVRIAL